MPNRRTCGTMPFHRHLVAVDEAYRVRCREIEGFTAMARRVPRTEVARIPVVVHVLYRTAAENISAAQVQSQIDVLNADFRARNEDRKQVPEAFAEAVGDPLLEFLLATRDPGGGGTTGITRARTRVQAFDGDIAELDDEIKAVSPAWPADRYLNLWACTLGGGLLGYAQFPGGPPKSDGVVVLNRAFGTMGSVEAPFDRGRTATHEVGHWLNLLHIWGDDQLGCRGSDSVADTPNQAGSNGGCPAFPRVSCSNGPHGDMFMNYMDYTDDACMCAFTRGQVARMNAALLGPRKTFLGRPADRDVVSGPAVRGPREWEALSAPDAAEREVEAGTPATLVFDGVDWV